MAKYHGYGTVTKEYKTLKPTKNMCSGCYCDFYNYQVNLNGIKGCWSFESSKVCDKEAYPSIHAYKTRKYKKTLTCYRGVNK